MDIHKSSLQFFGIWYFFRIKLMVIFIWWFFNTWTLCWFFALSFCFCAIESLIQYRAGVRNFSRGSLFSGKKVFCSNHHCIFLKLNTFGMVLNGRSIIVYDHIEWFNHKSRHLSKKNCELNQNRFHFIVKLSSFTHVGYYVYSVILNNNEFLYTAYVKARQLN